MNLLRIAVPVPVDREFDYLAPADAGDAGDAVGRCVRVRFGPRMLVGVVVAVPSQSAAPEGSLLPIEGYADELPAVSADVLALARFAADYYQYPIGLVLAHAVPPRGRRDGTARGEAPAAYRVTSTGRAGMTMLPKRALRQRELAEKFATDGTALRSELQAGSPLLRSLLSRWIKAGWLEAVPDTVGRAGGTLVLPRLTPEQSAASSAIIALAGTFQPVLLHGITASGKTEVYLAAASAAIQRGEQVLLLVPEINLTPQLATRMQRALPHARIVQLHSNLSDAQRLAAWRAAADGRAQLVLGTRLSVFASLPRLGLIIVDEEHDTSYKQQDGLRYIARDLAVYRARLLGIPVVLGSATPALETLWHSRAGRYRHLALRDRAIAAHPPVVFLVPQRDRQTQAGISAALRTAIAARLARAEQTLLFINRRGYAPSLLCAECGWAAKCHRCSARLVVHLHERRLRCHHCGHEEPIPAACPQCGSQDLLPLGFGTQRLEEALREQFPAARVARIDADSTRRKGSWAALLQSVLAGDIDVLVGTQMLAKGHDFPRLTLVGVLGADNALYSADFRATERLFAQLTQVAGRAGRAEWPGEVIVQTDFPSHPVYSALLAHDYDAHATALLAERRQLDLPPFTRLALLRAESPRRAALDRFLAAAHDEGLRSAPQFAGVRLYPPVAARMARRAGFERTHMLVQCAASRPLQGFLAQWRAWLTANAPRTLRWGIDVDPQDLD
ncbi:MAG: primosomal protein N' [Betaproteobacteria bacterium]